MKRVLTTCLGLFAAASVAFAQGQPTSPVQDITPLIKQQGHMPLPTPGNNGPSFGTAVEQDYIFFTPILSNDSLRLSFSIPTALSSTEWRGAGTILPLDKIYELYAGSVYDDTTTYMQQFNGAGAWTLDSFRIFVNQDPTLAAANFSGKILVLKTSQNFYGSNPATWNGFVGGRHSLEQVAEYEMTPESLATTATENPNDPTSYFINSTVLGFDPPLQFNPGEAAIILYVNDDAPAIPIANVTRESEVQRVQVQLEWAEESSDVPANRDLDSLDWYKSLGVIMYRNPTNGADSIYHPNNGRLTFTINNRPRSAQFGLWQGAYKGTVDLNAGVKYHFGTDAKEQGITAISPNPAREAATVNFALKQPASVSLDLYDGNGNLVKHIVESRYIPGSYSYTLETADLPAGNYLVRLTAGTAGYSGKFTVVK